MTENDVNSFVLLSSLLPANGVELKLEHRTDSPNAPYRVLAKSEGKPIDGLQLYFDKYIKAKAVYDFVLKFVAAMEDE